ncbi:MAG: LuxR C-terminal-related transcriptional regulator [Pseudomonadota bacterium]
MLSRYPEAPWVRDVFYGYMLETKGYIRHDVCIEVTFPPEIMALYAKGGGLTNDPVPARVSSSPSVDQYDFYDFRELAKEEKGRMLAHNPFITGLVEAGYTTAWTYPLNSVEKTGYAAMTLYQDVDGRPIIDPKALKAYTHKFHQIVMEEGFLGSLFDIGPKDIRTLRMTAAGKTAADIADLEGISSRTIELRLKSAREALKARSTAEAVFKASSYGLLKRQSVS